MRNLCPTCGAETFPGARFCRRCGAVLQAPADGPGQVSPQAATVPLKDEGRATDGLAPEEEPSRASADTTRVSRAELERLLREHETGERPDRDAGRGSMRTRPGRAYDPAQDAAAFDQEATLAAHGTGPTDPAAHSSDLEDLTVTVPRRPFDTRGDTADFGGEMEDALAAPPRPTRETDAFDGGETASFEDTRPAGSPREAGSAGATPAATRRRAWPIVVALCASVLVLTVAAAWLASRFWRGSQPTDAASEAPVAPPPAPDARQQFEGKLAEAEALLAQGNMEGALARLREANAIDPSNTRARRRLAELLMESGSRREAIEELKSVARVAPEDFTAWRQLASAQYAEGLYRDAADSYRRLLSLVGDSAADPNDLLSYADALRLSGRVEEARAAYQRLTANASSHVATFARQRLAELSQPTPTPADAARTEDLAAAQQPRQDETAAAQQQPPQPAPHAAPTPAAQTPQAPPPQAPSDAPPAEHYRRGVELWATNRAAALSEFQAAARSGNPEAHYYLGLNYVEGKNIHGLKRAEVVAALQHFQLAQRGGRFSEKARRYAQQLEREFDRLRKQ